MPFYVYMLECANGSYYVGQTDDPEKRLAQHNRGEIAGYTSARLPVRLVWSEHFPSREEALAFEQQIKRWSRAKKQALAAGDWGALQRLSRSGSPARGSTSSPRTGANMRAPRTGPKRESPRMGPGEAPRTGTEKGVPRTGPNIGSPRTGLGASSSGAMANTQALREQPPGLEAVAASRSVRGEPASAAEGAIGAVRGAPRMGGAVRGESARGAVRGAPEEPFVVGRGEEPFVVDQSEGPFVVNQGEGPFVVSLSNHNGPAGTSLLTARTGAHRRLDGVSE